MTANPEDQKLEEELKKKLEEDDDEKFIRKDEPGKDEPEEENNVKLGEEVQGIISKLKNFIFPENKQVRTLDHEVGGLEAEEQKATSSVDIWDERSNEVDQMGTDHAKVFNSSGMRSVVWKKKRERLEAEEAMEAEEAPKKGGKRQKTDQAAQGLGVGAVTQQSFVAKAQMKRDMKQEDRGGGRY